MATAVPGAALQFHLLRQAMQNSFLHQCLMPLHPGLVSAVATLHWYDASRLSITNYITPWLLQQYWCYRSVVITVLLGRTNHAAARRRDPLCSRSCL